MKLYILIKVKYTRGIEPLTLQYILILIQFRCNYTRDFLAQQLAPPSIIFLGNIVMLRYLRLLRAPRSAAQLRNKLLNQCPAVRHYFSCQECFASQQSHLIKKSALLKFHYLLETLIIRRQSAGTIEHIIVCYAGVYIQLLLTGSQQVPQRLNVKN